MRRAQFLVLAGAASALACGGKSNAEYQAELVDGMHATLLTQISALRGAAEVLREAGPMPAGRGWDPAQDRAGIDAVKAAWLDARLAYERTEGALAPLFPDIDAAIDARLEDFLESGPDADPFDDRGVTGMHAIERIVYSDVIPPAVLSFEADALREKYFAPAFPSSEAEARRFKEALCDKLVQDTRRLESEWQPAKVDIGGAFGGLIGLMNEQREKISKASTFEEESRYSQRTMADLRANLAGSREIYALFRPWLQSLETTDAEGRSGVEVDAAIEAGFAALERAYTAHSGDALPPTPATWSSINPTAADLATPFGTLYTAVKNAVDPAAEGSVVDEMNHAASMMGFPQFAE